MNTKTIILSSSGLKNVILSRYVEDDFFLVFGEQRFQMKSFFAEFISPIVSHLHQSDPTIETIDFSESFHDKSGEFKEFSKSILTDETISLLQQISSGFTIDINEDQAFKMRLLSIILGNEELFIKINESFPPDYIEENVNTYLNNIQIYYYFSQFSPDFDFSGVISFISNHFYLLDQNEFLQIPRRIQYLIISNPELQIQSEDSLLDIVLQIIESDHKKDEIDDICFLEQIEFVGLSEDKLRQFLNSFDINEMNSVLWKNLFQCFFNHFDQNTKRILRKIKKDSIEFDGNEKNRFNGILTFLGKGVASNALENEIIDVSASSVYKGVDVPSHALHYDSIIFFQTNPFPDSWFCIDFKKIKVKPSHYSIKSNTGGGRGYFHLQSWNIEGSNDKLSWDVLDSRRGEKSLDDRGVSNTFEIQNKQYANNYYRYIRIIQRGLNTHNSNSLAFTAIEFFGDIQSY